MADMHDADSPKPRDDEFITKVERRERCSEVAPGEQWYAWNRDTHRQVVANIRSIQSSSGAPITHEKDYPISPGGSVSLGCSEVSNGIGGYLHIVYKVIGERFL